MSQSFVKQPGFGSHSALFVLGVLTSEQPRPLCSVCGTPYEKHGSYPTCASHPYTPDANCQHVGTLNGSVFVGAPCAGAECKNGCVRALGVAVGDGQTKAPADADAPIPAEVGRRALEAWSKLLKHFPTEGDMHEASWEMSAIDEACNAYDAARAAITELQQALEKTK